MVEIERYMGPISSSFQPEAYGAWVSYSDYVQVLAEALAEARQSERQRVREAAKAFFAQELETSEMVGTRVEADRTRSLCEGLLAALDSLEDDDG